MAEDFDIDLVATFDDKGECVTVYLDDLQWNYKERVLNMMNKGRTQLEAQEIVRTVIAEKEHDPGVSVTFKSRYENPVDSVLCIEDGDDF